MPDTVVPVTPVRGPGRPPKSATPDLRVFAVERLLAGLAQAREAVRMLSIPDGDAAAPIQRALAADITQAEATARTLRRVLEG